MTGGHSFSDIALTLVEFNTTGETEQYDYVWSEVDGSQTRMMHDDVNHASISSINAAFGKKLALLNTALENMGFKIDLSDPKWGYQESQGQTNRTELKPLDCADYPGVILPGRVCAMPMS